uniref:Uncharacterized protein n=1 Tax=Acrobeloides nanus TaxID=290746 RepID=A0A914EI96_9BILA
MFFIVMDCYPASKGSHKKHHQHHKHKHQHQEHERSKNEKLSSDPLIRFGRSVPNANQMIGITEMGMSQNLETLRKLLVLRQLNILAVNKFEDVR